MIRQRKRIWNVSILGVFLLLVMRPSVFGFTLTVQEPNGAPVNGYRWLVEKDISYNHIPGVPVGDSLGVGIHMSHAPVLISGRTDPNTSSVAIILPTDQRYMVSVLPDSGHTMGGANVAIDQNDVIVTVNTLPLPTALITIYVFEDNQSINGAMDLPAEPGLEGFSVLLFDQLGQMMYDAFGNMLGTTYQQDPNGQFILDPDGAPVVDTPGTGVILTDPNGEAVIRYLPPGKYGIRIVPPLGTDWIQTSTLEGTPGNDVWVRAGEPRFTAELGFLNWLVFYGFVHPMTFPTPPPGVNTSTVTGRVVYAHSSRPPLSPGLNSGPPVPEAYVGLNNLSGADEQVYTQPCNGETGEFVIENVPPGTYLMTFWDLNLDAIIDFRTIVVDPAGGLIEMGDVPVFRWFGSLIGSVFLDNGGGDPTKAGNGFRDPGEVGIPEQNINIRFKDGSIYQMQPTDVNGEYFLEEVFPFWRWMIGEVDFARFKDTGMTTVVDYGGPIPPDDGWNMPSEGVRNPQPQAEVNPNTGNNLSRTQVSTAPGEVLLEAFWLNSDQNIRIDWGKKAYGPNENGGITGVVYYATTRGEDDPRLAAADPWEPGIPRIQINLYQDANIDGIIDDLNGSGGPTLADVDNYPFGFKDGAAPGPEDIDRNGNSNFDPGDAIQIVTTDSFDDNKPEGSIADPFSVHGTPVNPNAEMLRTWNQVRPSVFDGGYAFGSYFPGGIVSGSSEVDGLPTGTYIIEAANPPGYEDQKEEDKNVDFGESYVPSPQLLPPICVGDLRTVPDELSLFPGVSCAFAGQNRPLPDRKQVAVAPGKNAACDFFKFTFVPKAALAWGWVTDDLHLEFDPNSPNKGGNYSPSWIPIAFRDHLGREIVRVYTDEWGHFNALLPSTYTINPPIPTGVSPHMISVLANDPGPIPDPCNPGQFITDPWFNPAYGQEPIRENWDFWPGKTTHIDTIIIPIAAFVVNRTPLDCQFPDGTPVINSVMGPEGGSYVAAADGSQITIMSRGMTTVPNPDYDPSIPGSMPTIQRDFGFGSSEGTVMIGNVELADADVDWAVDGMTIAARIQPGITTGQITITRGDNGMTSKMGVTLHVGATGAVLHVGTGQPLTSIQQAIDIAGDHDLILVHPGTYKENLIMYKPVKIQGSGAFSTIIDSFGFLQDLQNQANWLAKWEALTGSGDIALIEGQQPDLAVEKGAGITVASSPGRFTTVDRALIDGVAVTGALETGGGIFVYGYGKGLQIGNTHIHANQGSLGGGIRVGTPSILTAPGDAYVGSENQDMRIHHSLINTNGTLFGNGGGISLYKGCDNYEITNNWICGNYAIIYGGGISHFGLINNGLIAHNTILNNESVDEGAGIMVSGELVPAGAPVGTLTEGAGSVTINSNLIQGNFAGDDGGGIRTLLVNGQDVQVSPDNPNNWYKIEILNNIVVNNCSADRGGGMSFDDTARIFVINNTVAHNDSTSTGSDAFGGPVTENAPPGQPVPPEAGELGAIGGITNSIPQVAGIASNAHSTGLQDAFDPSVLQEFSNPVLEDNIIWQNRTFWWDANDNGGFGGLRPHVTAGEPPIYWDLAVYGTAAPEVMMPHYSILTTLVDTNSVPIYDATNSTVDPMLVNTYNNDYQTTSKGAQFGNFVTTTFLPTGLRGDYHIGISSPAAGFGGGSYFSLFPELASDFDMDNRIGYPVDSGADQIVTGAPTPVEVIVDNLDIAATSVGVWSVSSASGFWATNSVWANDAGDSFTFNANLVSGVAYAVYEWHTVLSNRYTAVPHEIRNGTLLLDTVNVDQTAKGGQWNLLGIYTFNSPASVTILATPGFSTCADAIRFVPLGALQSLTIIAGATVNEGTTHACTAMANFAGPVSLPVQPQVWNVDVPQASISPTGVLTAGTVDADTPVVITAEYTLNGTTVSDTHDITIINSGGTPVEVIVDNLDATTSSVGVWLPSGASGFWASNSVWANDTGDSFTFNANLVSGVAYRVYEWHTQWPSRYTAVPHQIRSGATLLATPTVNQQINGGQWNLLGTFTFTGPASVTILATPGFSSCADAIRLEPVTTPIELIVDNLDAATSSVGVWLPSSAAGFWAADSVWANDAGDSFTFNANLIPGTNYEVYEWHTQWPSRYTAVPHEIRDGVTLLATPVVNQQVNGAQWNLLGTYTFSGPASVTILATPGYSNNADAIRFVPVP